MPEKMADALLTETKSVNAEKPLLEKIEDVLLTEPNVVNAEKHLLEKIEDVSKIEQKKTCKFPFISIL
jgi:hypothetical protein